MPLSLLLIPFGLFLLLHTVWSLAMLYHLFRYGYNVVASSILAVIYIAGTVMLLIVSVNFIQDIDWTQTISLGI